jgi:hypothetical protein
MEPDSRAGTVVRHGLIATLAIAPLVVQAQTGTVRGAVVDSEGDVVKWAGIWIDNAGTEPADSAGRFIIAGLAPGDHTLRVTSFWTERYQTSFRVMPGETTSVRPVVRRTTPREVWLGCAAVPNTQCVTGRVLHLPLGWFPRERIVVKDKDTWVALWKRARRDQRDVPRTFQRPPAIDWSREMVVISSVGSDMYDANGGDPVSVNRVTYEPDRVAVVIGADTIIRRGKCCLDEITSPVAVVIPRSEQPVVFRVNAPQ